MAKGSGLSFDSDRIGLSLHKPTVINSFPDHHHHHYQSRQHNNWKLKPPPMEPTRSSPPPTIQFQVNLNCTSHHQQHHLESSDDQDHDHRMNEMDFFADRKDVDCSTDHSKLAGTSADAHTKDSSGPTTDLDFNINTGLHLLTANTSSDQSVVDDGISANSDDKRAKNKLAVVQAELERMNAENQNLREVLNQVTTNYNTLQMHLMSLMQHKQTEQQQQQDRRAADHNIQEENINNNNNMSSNGSGVFPRRFMELGLAPTAELTDHHEPSQSSSEARSHDERSRSPLNNNTTSNNVEGVISNIIGREDSPDQAAGSHVWGPNKVPRSTNSAKTNATSTVDQATEATIRKARVSVRARSEALMITDGCQWRKYGQKMAKGNPCPRAYYRCTMAAGCPVRKQVQRCADDKTILITTYEGNHNHPLPPAAMAMASTTSSAARMLLSGSMPSADGLMNSNFLARTLLPCSSSMATISASAPFPTVTLDLTQTPNPLQFQRPPNQFQVPFANPSQNFAGGPNAAAASLLPQIFGQAICNQSKFSGLQMSQDHMDGTTGQFGHQSQHLPPMHHQGPPSALADTVTALTADPNFTAALAAAISSIIGGSHPNNVTNNNNNNNNNNNANVAATTTSNNNGGSVTTSNNNSHGNNKVSS